MSESLIRLKNNLRNEIEQALVILEQAKKRQRRVDPESESGRVAYNQATEIVTQVTEEVEKKQEALAGIESGEGDYYCDLLAAEESISRAAYLRQKSRAKEKAKTNAANDEKKEAEHKRYRKERRGDRWDKRKYGIYLRKFQYAAESLPPYIRENLRSMPNNKGYVWRGVYFYGSRLPERGEPSVVFEKNRGGGTLDPEVLAGREMGGPREAEKRHHEAGPIRTVEVLFHSARGLARSKVRGKAARWRETRRMDRWPPRRERRAEGRPGRWTNEPGQETGEVREARSREVAG